MKPESMGYPDIYLGGKLLKFTMNNGVNCWSLSASKYVHESVRNVKAQWHTTYPGRKWPRQPATPFIQDCLPKLDISEELNPAEANYYQ